MKDSFKAVVVRESNGEVSHNIEMIDHALLSDGEVIIKVVYSSVNYKDMLATKTNGGVIRTYPMIPGIDLSGIVVSSKSTRFCVGDKVLVTGFDIGMKHTGGYCEYARVPSEWIVKLPERLSMRDSMAIGTAGFTAALSILKLEENGMTPDKDQEILVTGGLGGVGSIAIQILKASGYKKIIALARDVSEHDALVAVGADKVILSSEIISEKPRLLEKQKFHYVLDVVGGFVASSLLSQIYYGGSMSMCGNAGGVKVGTSVMPFILRGVSLLGIDSVNYPIEKRAEIWNRFTTSWNMMDKLLVTEIEFEDLDSVFDKMKIGKHAGRYVVRISDDVKC